ncbi:MAG: DNA repair protein RecO [Bdellovibrio sp.]|nr:MAG: DNA repair protein RecO [Bdellovibrio sp.]
MLSKDKVFILKTTPFQDSDLIVNAFSAQEGRVDFLVKGARKSKKRFVGGVLEPSHYVFVLYYKKRSYFEGEGGLHILKEAHLIEDFSALRLNYERLEMALYFLKLVYQVARHGDPHAQDLFNLLGNGLKALMVSENIENLKIHFETKLLYYEGVYSLDDLSVPLLKLPLSKHQELSWLDDERKKVIASVQRVLRGYLNK